MGDADGILHVHLERDAGARARIELARLPDGLEDVPGPMLLDALKSQDMYLAGSFLMFLSLLTVVGMFLSDIALAALDPRIRLQGGLRR